MEKIHFGYAIILFGIIVLLSGFAYDIFYHQKNPGLTLETEGPFAIEHIPFNIGMLVVLFGEFIGIYYMIKKKSKEGPHVG